MSRARLLAAALALAAAPVAAQPRAHAPAPTPVAPAAGPGEAAVQRLLVAFPRAHAWFRQVAGIRYDATPRGYSPDWSTIRHAAVRRYDSSGQRLAPVLPLRADGAVTVAVEGADGLWVRATPLDAAPARGEVVDGLVAYPGAYPGATLVYKLTPTHVDEYVFVPAPVASAGTHRYRLELGPGIARARAAGPVLEFTDREGVARLRIARPFARDAAGARRDGTFALQGDVLTLTVDLAGLTFPVLIDPDWALTGRMVREQFESHAFPLPGGDGLVVGGCALAACPIGLGMPHCAEVLSTVERFSSRYLLWNNVAPMRERRFAYAGLTLDDGRILVAAGCTTPGCTAVTSTAETYDPAGDRWTAAPSLATARGYGVAVRLRGGAVLVVGGCAADQCVPDADVLAPGATAWRRAAPMAQRRGFHTAVALADGRVLVAGGCEDVRCNRVLASAELYDPAADRWTALPPMSAARADHTAALVAGGDVLVAGGCATTTCEPSLESAERFNPGALRWSAAAPMGAPRHAHSTWALPDGTVAVAGGCGTAPICNRTTEAYDPASNRWTEGSVLRVNRGFHASAVLEGGRLFVAGGCDFQTCLSTAEVYAWAAGDAGVDAGAPTDAGRRPWGDPDAGRRPWGVLDAGTTPPSTRPGCGCRAQGAPGARSLVAVALAAALSVARRRRR